MINRVKAKREIRGKTELRAQIVRLKHLSAKNAHINDLLGDSEARYRVLFEKSPTSITLLNASGVIIDCNKATEHLTGYTKEELIGKPYYRLLTLSVEDRAMAKEYYERLFKGTVVQPFELEIIRKDGKKRWITVISSSLNRQGKVAGFQIISQDITKHKEAFLAQQDSEEKFRSLLKNSPDFIINADREGRILFINRTVPDLTMEKTLGNSIFDYIMPQYHQAFKKIIKYVFHTRQVSKIESTGIGPNGRTCWYETRIGPITHNGTVVSVMLIATDVTERKNTIEALRQSEEKYKTLTENINVGIYRNTIGPKGKFIEGNASIIKIFGYKDRDEFLRINVADLYQNPEDRKKFNQKITQHGFVKDEELRLKKKDGTPFIAAVSAVAVKDDKGEIKYYDGMIEDITNRKSAEHALQRSFSKLQRVLEETVNALASTLGKRDPYTAGHQHRVTDLACAIAKELGLSRQQIKGIRLAGLLHDIGKIAIPAEILSKPSQLTDAEFSIVKEHAQIGYEILRTVEFPWSIAEIVLQHHELLDGSGYPQGLRDKDILIEAKIMVVADVVEAMCSHRPYRPAHSLETTLNEIAKYRGILYDERVVDACLRLFRKRKFTFEHAA